ncbi:McrB family protein [uncultured Deefgea sp.]|uniref:McrB family protein n=1 Tax=uncultured Deefgea sp. TaxID=1304914 RepID=UPI00259771EB|nr:AAA family ATPase [uncultured Deefgea sp.]
MEENKNMPEYTSLYALWDEFCSTWPIEKLKAMDLSVYSKSGDKDTFSYWIESRLDKLGSVWGGSAFKFGIFSRKDKSEKEDGGGSAYSDEYGWYSKYGSDEVTAFHLVKNTVISIVEAAQRGDLAAIEAIDFGEAIKWKIAFHYQDRTNPCIVDIYKTAPLRSFLGNSDKKYSMADLQRMVLEKKDSGEGILEFGSRVWENWKEKNVSIWKISHGNQTFSEEERQEFFSSHLAVMHEDTGNEQGKDFQKAPIGAIIFLCHGNAVQLLGRLTGPAAPCLKGQGWIQRPYEVLKKSNFSTPYDKSSKKWTPRGNSTFWNVPKEALPEFEETLLKPYFSINLEDIMELDVISSEAPITPLAEKVVDVGPLNRILYGPPGTGKTYRSVAEAVALIEGVNTNSLIAPDAYKNTKVRFDHYRDIGQIEFVTFHPSYAYQDFVEGIRPSTNESGQLEYSVEPGVLKRIALAAQSNWLASKKTPDSSLTDDERFERSFTKVIEDIEESEHGFVQTKLKKGSLAQVRAASKGHGLVLSLPDYPTVYNTPKFQLKKLWANRAAIEVPSDIKLYNASFFWAVLKLLESADINLGQPESVEVVELQRYVLVIDEINRGNIAKIFGELITLIEDDKRLGADNELTVRLPYTPDEPPFGLPPNLLLLGTMNTADRSIALLDTALRRRFHFEELMPNPDVLTVDLINGVSVKQLLSVMNRRIAYLFDRDHTIGHAYFSGVKTFAELEARFLHKIIPLLQEYFFDDWSKIQLIFRDGASKSASLHIIRKQEDEAAELFGVDSELGYGRITYQVVDRLTPEMLKAIYE